MAVALEIPVFGSTSADIAVQAGAARLELNASGSYAAGGLTPALHELAQLQDLEVPIRVMIRPRGPPRSGARDFVYSDEEFVAMEQSIQRFKASGLLNEERGDGFVFGVLRRADSSPDTTEVVGSLDNYSLRLDVERCKRLAGASRPYKAVFHRAFDELVDSGAWESAMEQLVLCGVDGILTSGGLGNAVNNIQTLTLILGKAGNDIEIIVGGGVRSTNAGKLMRSLQLGAWVHSSCLTSQESQAVDTTEARGILSALRFLSEWDTIYGRVGDTFTL